MLFGGKKSKQLVGLDIGSSSIKSVELKSTKAGYELVSFGMESLAPDTVVDGAIMDAPQVANAISRIFDSANVKTKNVATSVSGHSVIVKRVPLPLMSEEELYDRIPAEASQHIPFDIADVNLSYQLLESMDAQMDVLQKELDLSFEDAERLKKGETLPSVTDEQKQQILRSVSDILTLEIQKTFDFFRATASGENIQRIVVAGGTARVPGLVDLLREEFAMPVEELNPFRKVLINPSRHSDDQIRELAPRLAIAVGLALRSFD